MTNIHGEVLFHDWWSFGAPRPSHAEFIKSLRIEYGKAERILLAASPNGSVSYRGGATFADVGCSIRTAPW